MCHHLLYVINFTTDTDMASYADENIPYASENTSCKVIEQLEDVLVICLQGLKITES